jgi:hypothetical protein
VAAPEARAEPWAAGTGPVTRASLPGAAGAGAGSGPDLQAATMAATAAMRLAGSQKGRLRAGGRWSGDWDMMVGR